MRSYLAQLHQRLRTTTLYVTHDQTEAMTMGDRVAVMRGGLLQQVASPQELYDRPANLFVAEFIGSPAMNLVKADLVDARLRFGEHALPLPSSTAAGRPGLAAYEGKQVVVGVRPEDLEDAALAREAPAGSLEIEVDIREDMGSEVLVHFSVPGEPVASREVLEAIEEEDVAGAVHERMRHGIPFIARLERRTRAREGERLTLAVDTSRLHFFDPETGLGIY
jgi:multiple sugar transport system ATP-binding protein